VAFDFHRDKIFKYKDDYIQVADEPLALRNAEVTFRTRTADIGTIPDNDLHDVACKTIGSEDYIAFTSDAGVTVIKALASGVAYSEDGPLPGSQVKVSEKGALYWSGYDQANNDGELSYFSNITALAASGTNSFTRTDYYGVDTSPGVFGSYITAFDVRTVAGADQVAVGTTEGISFIALSPGAPFTRSVSYGVVAPAENPIVDPSFENYLGLDWKVYYTGLHRRFFVTRETSFAPAGQTSLRLRFADLSSDMTLVEGTEGGVYQDVNFTGLSYLYFDCKLSDVSLGGNVWDFQILVGDTVVKSYRDLDGPFTKYNDSVDVSGYTGVHRLKFRLLVNGDTTAYNLGDREIYIDNLQTKIGDPDYRVLPAGNVSIKEVLLQYDSEGHKVYFSTQGGYGALDLDDHSLDYFLPVQTYVPEAENVSADFSRVSDEV
jgi:hypothetical protein